MGSKELFRKKHRSKYHPRENPEQKQPFIGHYQHAPSHQKDNPHIHSGYRINFNTPQKILKSLFMLHNQTVNVWTHLIPAILAILTIIYISICISHYSLVQDLNAEHTQFIESVNKWSIAMRNRTLFQKFREFQDAALSNAHEIQISALSTFNHLEREIKASYHDIIEAVKFQTTKLEGQALSELKSLMNGFQKIIEKTKNSQQITQLVEETEQIKSELQQTSKQLIQTLKNRVSQHIVPSWPITVLLACTFISFFCSSVFHLFCSMSSKWYPFFLRLDYAGISIIMAGTSFPYIYYTLYCDPIIATVYLGITSIFATCLFFLALTEWLHRLENRITKTVIYCIYASHYIVPIIHMLINEFYFGNFGDIYHFSDTLPLIACLFGIDGLGALFYARRCPERNNPGKYDICGHSHQIWHLCVAIGALVAYCGAFQSFELRKGAVCPI